MRRTLPFAFRSSYHTKKPSSGHAGWSVAQPWSPWLVNGQVAGYKTVYTDTTGEDFTFATVYHAGHMVPL